MKREIELADGLRLVCPMCGSEYMHQGKVQVFWRKEDAEDGQLIVCAPMGTTVAKEVPMTGCPSPRRSGLLITFDCEGCDAEPELAIYQHKGESTFQWYSARQKIQEAA